MGDAWIDIDTTGSSVFVTACGVEAWCVTELTVVSVYVVAWAGRHIPYEPSSARTTWIMNV